MPFDQVIPVAGFPIIRTNASSLADFLLEQVAARRKTALFFANTNFIVQCRHLLDAMQRDDVTIVNDGIGLDIAVRFINRNSFNENLCGSDFIPYFFSRSNQSLRVFMLGSKPEVLDDAARYAHEVLGQTVVGKCDGYMELRSTANLIDRINRTQAEVVLVAMGNPIQEEWIIRNFDGLRANVIMGVGALFDFWSGRTPRAPHLMRRLRLEWLFRLCLEPRRLLKRYTLDYYRFLMFCHRSRTIDSQSAPASASDRQDWQEPPGRA